MGMQCIPIFFTIQTQNGHNSLIHYMVYQRRREILFMNDENRYEPYQYGEPQFEEPDLEVESEVQEEPIVSRYDYSYTQAPQSVNEEKNKKKDGCIGKAIGIIAIAAIFGVVASAVFMTTNHLLGNYFKTGDKGAVGSTVNSTQVSTNKDSVVNSDIADVAESVMPSVVSITNMSVQEVQNFFFGGVTQYESTSTGSGIVIGQNDKELLIVSNNHVVEGSKSLTVTFIDETSVDAQIKGTDSDMDLAIISIPLTNMKKETLDAIKIATLGDSDALRVGEPTIAIGNALGYGQSVTSGIVSAVERTIEGFDGKLIQTDAAINPGNSGGALLNANGEVIGINTVKVSADAVEGMGYAIPISDVTDILNELMNKVTRTKVPEAQQGFIGIQGTDVDENAQKYYGMPAGVYVDSVIKGGGAEAAKLPAGCIITEIDGTAISTMKELKEQLTYYKAGETVDFTIAVKEKGYKEEETIKIKLTKIID